MMLLAVHGILGEGKDVPQNVLSRVPRVTALNLETQGLSAANKA